MITVRLSHCPRCGVPHVPKELAAKVRAGENVTVEIVTRPVVSDNVLAHGTGALNIGATRIAGQWERNSDNCSDMRGGRFVGSVSGGYAIGPQSSHPAGRWPANLILGHSPECERIGVRRVKSPDNSRRNPLRGDDPTPNIYGEWKERSAAGHADLDCTETVEAWRCAEGCPIAEMDRQSGERAPGRRGVGPAKPSECWGGLNSQHSEPMYNDSGGASRFFLNIPANLDADPGFRYVAKAPASERWGLLRCNRETCTAVVGPVTSLRLLNQSVCDVCGMPRTITIHPTQKPVALMSWLVKLVTPPNGLVLDPFAGSGSTGVACVHEGFRFVGIDAEPEYVEIAERRIAHAVGPIFARAAD